jgi:hypothetical protein
MKLAFKTYKWIVSTILLIPLITAAIYWFIISDHFLPSLYLEQAALKTGIITALIMAPVILGRQIKSLFLNGLLIASLKKLMVLLFSLLLFAIMSYLFVLYPANAWLHFISNKQHEVINVKVSNIYYKGRCNRGIMMEGSRYPILFSRNLCNLPDQLHELIQTGDTLILEGQSSMYGMDVEKMEITNQL